MSLNSKMGGFWDFIESRIHELWHYNTTFGSLWFNVIAVNINVLQLVITAAILGFWHSYVTIEHIWWPAFECVRIFILTICRVNCMLKNAQDFRINARATAQLRRIIMFCNLVGAASLSIGAPIYLFLLPNNDDLMYLSFLISFIVIILARIGLTFPMFVAIIFGTSFYSVIDGNYERIDDMPDNQAQQRDPLLEHSDDHPQISLSTPHRGRSRFAILAQFEQQQLQRAIEASRYESIRNQREAQDKEYEKALAEQRLLESVGNPNLTEIKQNTSMSSLSSPSDELTDESDELSREEILKQEKEEAMREIINDLPRLKNEPSKTEDTVSIRVRLPNGKRLSRRFDRTDNIGSIKTWVNHELVQNDNAELINDFELVSTMPRTIYMNDNETMQNLRFWRQNAKRECHSPLLYVEDITPNQYKTDDSSVEDID